MADIYFSNVSIIVIIFYLQIEVLFYFCFSYVIFFAKNLKIQKTYQIGSNSPTHITDKFIYYFLVIAVISVKGSSPISMFMVTSVFVLKFSKILILIGNQQTKTNFSLILISPFFASTLYLIYYVDSFLTLFFFIELYGILYYFCFLSSYNFANNTVLKYKNGILFLLWNNFLTTFFLGLSCFFFIRVYGTSSFAELSLITTGSYYVYMFLIGLFWKLGLPLFHFFKLEVYKFLLKENIFAFSFITTLINSFILIFTLSKLIVISTLYYHNFLIILIVFGGSLIIVNLKLTNILLFFALSSVLTLSIVISVYVL